jgi:hypothetical protein
MIYVEFRWKTNGVIKYEKPSKFNDKKWINTNSMIKYEFE